jgi:hypothetical protein
MPSPLERDLTAHIQVSIIGIHHKIRIHNAGKGKKREDKITPMISLESLEMTSKSSSNQLLPLETYSYTPKCSKLGLWWSEDQII